jgi:hypothetical protein
MEKIPARAGWLWVKRGFALFRKQPGGLSTLFLAYLFLMLAVSILPLMGQIAQVILMPVFSITFMQACLHIEQNRRIRPNLLAAGFHKPAIFPLLGLGLLYLLAAGIAIGVSTLADDGLFWKLASGQLDPKSPLAQNAKLSNGFLLAALVYIPAAMAFFFAAPLIYWKKMSLGKALFFSFFAVLKAIRAFIVFVLAWFVICMLASQFVVLIFGLSELAVMIMLPLWVTMVVVLQGSFFAAYAQIFGAPADTEAAAAPDASAF